MSVVGSDYDQLKRFNLAEIYNPSNGPTLSKKAKPKEIKANREAEQTKDTEKTKESKDIQDPEEIEATKW